MPQIKDLMANLLSLPSTSLFIKNAFTDFYSIFYQISQIGIFKSI